MSATVKKTHSYFEHFRSDVLAMIPDDARTFLSIGCGAGRTEHELVRRGHTVVGVEPSDAADVASQRGIEVLRCDAASASTHLSDRVFDCMIYADVLEHVQDPAAILMDHVAMLRPGGSVIVSVPNFRHYSVLHAIFFRGIVPYTDSGIFDDTHLRITTRRSVEGWFAAVGLDVSRHDFRLSRRRDRYVNVATAGVLQEFLARQVIVVGRLSPANSQGA